MNFLTHTLVLNCLCLIMLKCKASHLWQWAVKLVQNTTHSRRLQVRFTKLSATKPCMSLRDITLISLCLIGEVWGERTPSIFRRQLGICVIPGATHRYCVSVKELADKWRCLLLDPWRPAIECHSASVSGAWEESLAANCSPQTSGRAVAISKDKATLSALCTRLAPILISFSCLMVFWRNKSIQDKRKKLALCVSVNASPYYFNIFYLILCFYL